MPADDRGAPEGPETRAPRPRPPGTFRIGQIGGVDVLVTSSWFLIAALIAVVLAPVVESEQPGLGAWRYVAGLAFAVLLYGSVLLHEASHALAARHYGYPVDSITLHFLGGATAIEGESRRPGEEFWIAVVGPLTSIAVGLVAIPVWMLLPDGLLQLAFQGLMVANLLVGALNLIPGLPLDGGRVLKAAVWRASGNMHRGTIAAGWGGRATAVAILAWPLFMDQVLDIAPTLADYLLSVVVAVFLWAGATAAMQGAKLRRHLPSLVARRLARRTVTVDESLPVSEAVRLAQEAAAGGIVTVSANGSPVGVVNEAALLATPTERRPWMPVSSVARSLEEGMTLPVGLVGEELIRAITRKPAHEYLLIEDDGTIYGVLATADVDRAFSQR